ncbi:MAG: hypothetical protein QXH60_02395, partial [Candidatus Pacearchaeota archaeon]
MKNLLALLAVVAMIGVVVAQDLDIPKTGTAGAQQQAQQGGNGSIFDQLVARLNADKQTILSQHITGWWNRGYGYIGDWMSEWNRNIWGDAADWNYLQANLSPAEKAAFNQMASQAHNEFVAA